MPSAGSVHTELLRSDGRAVACGRNHDGKCNLPVLEEGATYTQVSAGACHTVLLRSDGTAVACGSNGHGRCNIPVLEEGATYTQVSAGGEHTVLLRSDGTAVACGDDGDGRCDLPVLEEGVCFAPAQVRQLEFVVQLFLEISTGIVEAVCRDLGGEQLASWIVADPTTLVKQSVEKMLPLRCRRLRVVLPDGRLVNPRLTWQYLLSGPTMGSESEPSKIPPN